MSGWIKIEKDLETDPRVRAFDRVTLRGKTYLAFDVESDLINEEQDLTLVEV